MKRVNYSHDFIKKVAYLECPTGIAGDMCLGALVDLGVPLQYLTEQLKKLGIEREYQLWSEKVHRNGQEATKVHVDLNTTHHHSHARHLPEIEQLIKTANLPPQASDWSLKVFSQLAVAEGAVHGISPEKVHFHEVGAIDAIVDIVGTCLGLDWLKIEEIYCSAMPTGGGSVTAAHGRLAVPVPAVLQLWQMRQVPVYSNGIEQELVTPTGAAIATTLATHFGTPPAMRLQKVGLGAGSKNLALPNILRIWLGEVATEDINNTETIATLETQIDDLNPQAIGYLFDILLEAGALDIFTQPVGMKKSRPGILLSVICPLEKRVDCERIIFRETTTLGIRRSIQERSILLREIQTVETSYGTIRVKIAYQNQIPINVQPEYEDCAAIAKQHDIPWRVVHQMALDAWKQINS